MPLTERRIGWVGPRSSYWGWILDHLPRVQFLESINAWQANSPDDLLLVALGDRVSTEWYEISGALKTLADVGQATSSPKKYSRKRNVELSPMLDSSVTLLLGESWVGHRRTFPIPESFRTFYWYELFDRLIPSLDCGIGRSDFLSPERGQRVTRWRDTAEELRKVGVSGKRILVVADSNSTHELWDDTLGGVYGSVLGVVPEQVTQFRFSPDMVLIDYDPGPPASMINASDRYLERVVDSIKLVRNRFPESMIAVACSFPRWCDWEIWTAAGADLFFPKPGCLLGLLWGMKRWDELSLAK